MIDSKFEAPFAWGLLDACVDVTAVPPRFRAPRDVPCFITLEKESVCFLAS